MPSFPKIIDLPTILNTTDWEWTPYRTPSFPSYDFWLGIDPDGNRWLTKLKGDFYAYRELVFARLAQKMGWSCQSSTFIQLAPQSAVVLGRSAGEVHAAHWFMEEHTPGTCSSDCPLKLIINRSGLTVDDLAGSRIAHLMDWPKSEIATCLFGGNELPGFLITTDHELIIIDSEQMFSNAPCDLTETNW